MSIIKNKKCFIVLISYVAVVFYGVEVCLPIAALLLFYVTGNRRFKYNKKEFVGEGEYIILLIVGLIIGILSVISGDTGTRDFIKHCAYVLLPGIFLMLGIRVGTTKNNEVIGLILRTLFYCGVAYSTYDVIRSIILVAQNISRIYSLYSFRSLIGTGTQFGVYTLFLLICFKDQIGLVKHRSIIIVMLILEILIHFSRLSIILSLIFLLFIFKSGFRFKYIKYLVGLSLAVLVIWAVFPEYINELLGKMSNSFVEISANRSTWSRVDIIQNWRGYEAYIEMEHFKAAPLFEKIFGGGLGTYLNIGEYARLVSNEDSLAYLHNGFYTILMVWGVLGIVLYSVMLIKMFIKIPYGEHIHKSYMQVLIITLALDTLLVHGPLFSVSGAYVLFIIGLLVGMRKNEIF